MCSPGLQRWSVGNLNRGASWSPRTDYQRTLTVGALAFNPAAPATAYCGTGEGDWWSWLGVGVLRSTNGGSTWSTLCTTPFVGDGFYALVVDPADAQRLYAGTRGGLWVSGDGGLNWTRRRTEPTWSISVRGGEVLAACRDGLFRSTNKGNAWNAVALPGTPGTFQRLAVAIAPSDPGVAYAWGASSTAGFLWRRAGGTWTAIGVPPGASVGQAWYDWYVAVAPDQANQVYCGAIDVHRGTLSGTTWTWVNLSSKTSGGNSIHPDQHAIGFEPGRPATIYAGNDGGVYRSDDRGINWIHCNNGLQVSEFEYIAHNIGVSRWLIGGTQDNGTNRWTGPSRGSTSGMPTAGTVESTAPIPRSCFTRGSGGRSSARPPEVPSEVGATLRRRGRPAKALGSSTRRSNAARQQATRSPWEVNHSTSLATWEGPGHVSPTPPPA